MSRLKEIVKYGALLIFGAMVAVALLEVALRVTGWAFLRAREPARASRARQPDDVIRVLCLGESTTADLSFSGKESYPAQLELMLNERSDTHHFIVINRGVPATTTDLIVESLPALLEEHRPDIVVTMMGINDGPLADPLFAVSSSFPSLRVWKLGRMLYHSLLGRQPGDPGVAPDSDRAASLEVASIPRTGSMPLLQIPKATMFQLVVSANFLMEGNFDEAEPILTRLADGSLEGDLRHVTTNANGQLAILNYQRGRNEEAARYHERFRELVDFRHNPKTTVNYTILRKIVAEHGSPLVAVQYPGRAIHPLRHVLREATNKYFVDNESTFFDVVKERPLKEVYRDLFGGVFGHLTPYGNQLLANNVADVILNALADSGSMTTSH